MREQVLDEVVARRFLLGELQPEEEGRIQELAFEDRDTFAFLESVEDDLIDEFIQGDLSADEAQHFESHFLSQPGRRNNLQISQILQEHLDKTTDIPRAKKFSLRSWWRRQNVWFQVSMAAVATAVVAALLIWIVNNVWKATHPVTLQAGSDRPGATPNPQFSVSPSLVPTPSPAHAENKPKSLTPEKQKRLATYALLSPSALSRGEGAQELPLPANTSSMTIELALITQGNFPTYEATLVNEAGEVLDSWSNLKKEVLTSGDALKVRVRTALLKPGEFYRIVVSGVSTEGNKEELAKYPFEAR